MSNSKQGERKKLSSLAIALETELNRFDQLAQDLAHVAVRSEKGFARARKLLVEVDEVRSRMGASMHELAQLLMAKQEESDKALQSVAEAAAKVQERHEEVEPIVGRFQILREGVRTIVATIVKVRKSNAGNAIEERSAIVQALPEITKALITLEEETLRLGDQARAAELKSIEENLQQLRQTIVSARLQLENLPRPPTNASVTTFIPPVHIS